MPMEQFLPPANPLLRFLKICLKITGALILCAVVAYGGLAFYLHTHKKEVLQKVTESLNNAISGTLVVGSMETTLIQDFPRISVQLKNVTLRDSLYRQHKHTFLSSGRIGISVNTLALIRGTILVSRIEVADALIDIFMSTDGYSNTAMFAKKKTKNDQDTGTSDFPELKKITLRNVLFTADNKKNNKLYKFQVDRLDAGLEFTGEIVNADINLKGFAHSMAFNTIRGSFMKDKALDGSFDIAYSKVTKIAHFRKSSLTIGKERFIVGAKLGFNDAAKFSITLQNESILWKDAAALLSPNITTKLMMFDIKKPIKVACDLIGGFNDNGDPLIQVNAWVNDNVLVVPGGEIRECNFFGVFTNERMQGREYSDANSAIKLFSFTGSYKQLPFAMPRVEIRDLDKPIAVGSFNSSFKISDLAGLAGADVLKPGKGTAKASLKFRADIERFRLVKPLVEGSIAIKNADITYVPRNLQCKNISVNLRFDKDNLTIDNVALKTGKSAFKMNGSVQNFLNLYYNAPEKLVLKWNVYSPELHLGEFLSFLQTRKAAVKSGRGVKVPSSGSNPVTALGSLFENGTVEMAMKADRVFYKKFMATNAHARIYLTETGNIMVKNMGLNHAGGTLELNGAVNPSGITRYNLKADVRNADVSKFLYAFDNFGMESLSSKNLKGLFSARADVAGTINQNGTLLPRSIDGGVTFTLKKGKLLDFDPIVSVGKFAFPFRDVKSIEFKDLNGRFDIKGEKVQVSPMQISSSVLNMDVEGVYSFGKGTLLYIDVPLRNPEKDKDITDKAELEKRRKRGVVVHLIAEDDEKGKVKIRLGKKK